ncbi:hypothetical protein AZI87_03225 [Bdellovibrio bacteriovorus]|uniref:Lipocalin-like domain-containing protein n=1 Tax=Bdellovibrio bacteriovorus TaxID=959 RepID=A0A162GJ86_BDEBC|nr:hypothetical protein [Bdellovibrio bacteriovorus]KYG68282.1 hypothetical protein AZI87_03225 [Bdellovibrio bacteriovorus]
MKKTVLLGLLLLGSSSAFASIQDYIGRYDLQREELKDGTFCYEGLIVSKEGKEISLYRSDITEFALVKSELNSSREVRSSHGEAMTTTKGKDSVTLKDDGTLVFQFSGIESILGVPASRVKDAVALKLSDDKSTLFAVRKTADGLAGLNRGEARCVYKRQ